MNGELAGKVAIVTGAARNIGRATAIALAQGGAKVVATALSSRELLDETVAAIRAAGGKAEAVLADVTEETSVRSLVSKAVERFGSLDILVNNAAIRTEIAFGELSLADFRKVTSVALEGPFLCARAALEPLSASKAGTIINIGGLTAYTGARDRVHVIAAKAGLDGMTKALAHDLAPLGITVNLVSPGMIDTVRGGHSHKEPEHHKRHATLVGRRGTPEEVAAIVRFLAGPEARYITGQTLHVNGGAYLP